MAITKEGGGYNLGKLSPLTDDGGSQSDYAEAQPPPRSERRSRTPEPPESCRPPGDSPANLTEFALFQLFPLYMSNNDGNPV